jgi:hypothetical protein
MLTNINDIIQTHMHNRACVTTTEEMLYAIRGGNDNMYHCKFTGDCQYKKVSGIITNCEYFSKLSEAIKKFQNEN